MQSFAPQDKLANKTARTRANTGEHGRTRPNSAGRGVAAAFAPVGAPAVRRKASCACGGGCPRCLQAESGLQFALRVSQPHDPQEQEADRIADEVMRLPEQPERQDLAASGADAGQQTRHPPAAENGGLRRKPNTKAGTSAALQARNFSSAEPEADPDLTSRIHALRGGGNPLPDATRSFFESRFEHDFAAVRVHSDSRAERLAASVDARAFALGNDIAFGRGEYRPDSDSGRRLLAHELAHVVQQAGSHRALLQRADNGRAARDPEDQKTSMYRDNPPAAIIYFATDSDALTADDDWALYSFERYIKTHLKVFPSITVQVSGRADSRGDAGYNLALSQRRADAVAEYLRSVFGGYDGFKLIVEADGELGPEHPDLSSDDLADYRSVWIKTITEIDTEKRCGQLITEWWLSGAFEPWKGSKDGDLYICALLKTLTRTFNDDFFTRRDYENFARQWNEETHLKEGGTPATTWEDRLLGNRSDSRDYVEKGKLYLRRESGLHGNFRFELCRPGTIYNWRRRDGSLDLAEARRDLDGIFEPISDHKKWLSWQADNPGEQRAHWVLMNDVIAEMRAENSLYSCY